MIKIIINHIYRHSTQPNSPASGEYFLNDVGESPDFNREASRACLAADRKLLQV